MKVTLNATEKILKTIVQFQLCRISWVKVVLCFGMTVYRPSSIKTWLEKFGKEEFE